MGKKGTCSVLRSTNQARKRRICIFGGGRGGEESEKKTKIRRFEKRIE
jgi:hypothetical protein